MKPTTFIISMLLCVVVVSAGAARFSTNNDSAGQIWNATLFNVGDPIGYSAEVGNCYVTTDSIGTLYVIDLKTGEFKWTYSAWATAIRNSRTVTGISDTVIVEMAGVVYGFDLESGALLYQFQYSSGFIRPRNEAKSLRLRNSDKKGIENINQGTNKFVGTSYVNFYTLGNKYIVSEQEDTVEIFFARNGSKLWSVPQVSSFDTSLDNSCDYLAYTIPNTKTPENNDVYVVDLAAVGTSVSPVTPVILNIPYPIYIFRVTKEMIMYFDRNENQLYGSNNIYQFLKTSAGSYHNHYMVPSVLPIAGFGFGTETFFFHYANGVGSYNISNGNALGQIKSLGTQSSSSSFHIDHILGFPNAVVLVMTTATGATNVTAFDSISMTRLWTTMPPYSENDHIVYSNWEGMMAAATKSGVSLISPSTSSDNYGGGAIVYEHPNAFPHFKSNSMVITKHHLVFTHSKYVVCIKFTPEN